jgi:hypothetical protein
VPNCFECTIGVDQQLEAIGVCMVCNSLGCAKHGGKPRGQPRFECAGCHVGLLTISAGGPPPPPGPGGSTPSGGSPLPGPGGGDAMSGTAQTGPAPGSAETGGFTSTLDFEMQLPEVAAASESWRRAVSPDSLRESVRRLFRLLQDEDSAIGDFLGQAEDELREPLRDQVQRQLRRSDAQREVFDERGGLDALTNTGLDEILNRLRRWLENDLEAWMARIHPTLDETVWLGERYGTGAIEILLLADAVGLNAYVWNIQIGEPPFRRLDIVGRCDTGMLVLSELYSQSLPAIAPG